MTHAAPTPPCDAERPVAAPVAALEAALKATRPVPADAPLRVGVDLGTASIVLAVLDADGEPVACAMEPARVVRDGLVVDYMGATRIVRALAQDLEARLGRPLTHAAMAVPPGTGVRESATHRHVIESADMEVVACLDEPTAANAVLGLRDGVIVDIGGGTTGLAVLQGGNVVYVADEATGGHHLSLVLAGHYDIPLEEAEARKKRPENHKEFLSLVRPVIQKFGSIISRHLHGRHVDAVYLVGGTACLAGLGEVLAQETGFTVRIPGNPLLVTPLGIALSCPAQTAPSQPAARGSGRPVHTVHTGGR